MSSKQANNNPGFYPVEGQKGPKLILEAVSEYYQDLATLPNAVFDSVLATLPNAVFGSTVCVGCVVCLVERLTIDDLE